ncbi:MAG: ABC transporter permease [Opitutae bacterium]|nr:ABC transporter permease [Opitutae bacterium]
MPWSIYLAFKQLFPPGKHFPAFALVSIIGVAIGVCSLLVVQTVMNGYGREHRENIQRMYGHVVVTDSHGGAIANHKALMATLEKVPGVVAASPFAEGQVMVRHGDIPALPFVRGIDLDKEDNVVPVKKFLTVGEPDALDDDRVIVGSELARMLNLRVRVKTGGNGELVRELVPGQTIEVYSPTMLDALKDDEVPMPVELEVCGLFESGYRPADENTIIVSLRRMQELYNLGKDVQGIRLRVEDPEAVEKIIPAICRVLPMKLRATPWIYVNWNFLQAVQFEKTLLFFLMFIITLVASFSIASTLFSAVVKRSREIGILGALGARPRQILMIFASQGVAVGAIGYGIGCVLTFVIIAARDEIVSFINSIFGSGDMIQTQYLFSQIPVHYNGNDFLVAAIFTILTTTVAGLIPAIWAARRKPSEAMREA